MPEATLEQRMTVLEEAVRELQQALNARQPAPDWLDRVIGSMKDEPAFDEVLAHGRAIRQADRPWSRIESAMKFLLDTDHISILQKQSGREYGALMARIAQVPRADLAFCIVSFHEQVLGCNTYLAQAKTSADIVRGYQMFDRVLSAFAAALVLPFDTRASAVFDGLVAKRVRIATMDLRIAAIACSQGLTLLTRNARDFSKVPGLVIEDWTI